MAGYFVDSSALVKRYVHETGSVWLSGLVASAAGNDIYIARITTVEVVAALTRRARGGTITAADARAACLLSGTKLETSIKCRDDSDPEE